MLYTLCYLIILITFAHALTRLYLGSKCSFNGAPALCKTFHDCPQAMESVLKTHKHNFTRCGFTDDDVEIVCCPHQYIETTSPPTQSRSAMACQQFYKGSIQKVESTVINGQDADENEFPHMVSLTFNSSDGITQACGGSLISDRFVLTAAHCFTHAVVPSKVRLGVTKWSDPDHLDVDIKNHTLHPLYDTRTKYHDVALVELAGSVNFSERIRPACLYTLPNDPQGLQVTGWGQTLNDSNADVLQKASLGIVPSERCDMFVRTTSFGMRSLNSTHQLCAIGKDSDSCNGDSGGPLQLERERGDYAIVGIVSHGPGGCSPKHPNSIYTRVSFYVKSVNFSERVRPACLYAPPNDPQGLQVTGWGQKLNGLYSDVLQKAPLGIVPSRQCDIFVKKSSLGMDTLNSTHQLCAIGHDTDSCNGDSGGPLQLERVEGGYAIVGIVSYGPKVCSSQLQNSIYTRVSFYVEWIEHIVWEKD